MSTQIFASMSWIHSKGTFGQPPRKHSNIWTLDQNYIYIIYKTSLNQPEYNWENYKYVCNIVSMYVTWRWRSVVGEGGSINLESAPLLFCQRISSISGGHRDEEKEFSLWIAKSFGSGEIPCSAMQNPLGGRNSLKCTNFLTSRNLLVWFVRIWWWPPQISCCTQIWCSSA